MEELYVKFVSPLGKTSKHIIYCKKHALRKNSSKTPNGRTLFSVGWPPYCREDDIKELFSRTSEVENIFLRNSPGNVEDTEEEALVNMTSFRRRDFSYVVFKTTGGLAQMLSLCKSKTPISCPITNTGLSVLLNDYNDKRPPVAVLEATAKRAVEKYDSWTDQEKTRKRLLSEPDEEGWVTIPKRAPAIELEGSTTKRKKKQKYHLKLYPFQMRETQRERLADLRKKFQEDKNRVAAMRAQRKFRPF